MPIVPDPYRTLGLTRGASLDEVKRAYRRLAKANHPDAAGPAALSRFLAIQAAYDQLTGLSSGLPPAGRGAPGGGPRPSAADPDRTEATRRAYRARPREASEGPEHGANAGPRRPRAAGPDGDAGPDRAAGPDGAPSASSRSSKGDESRTRAARGKATLGSTSYDGAEAGPFEPDWGGASWYGTTSGTYWTINPKEYADPRKHGPEYQARARRAAGARGVPPGGDPDARGSPPGAGAHAGPEPVAPPTHTTASWWDSTAGPEERTEGPPNSHDGSSAHSGAFEPGPVDPGLPLQRDDSAPDPARAAVDLGRALTDPRSGGLRGRLVRAVLGWIPIALGIGWLVGELTGCGRFAATCDPSVMPLTAAGQGIVLVALVAIPEAAAIAAGASLVLLAAAVGATLILSATGTAADENSRRAALGALLLVAWLSGFAIAVVRRLRSGSRSSRPVS
jgi:hypothetical protein